jgi:HSP90 family molecular chaperone
LRDRGYANRQTRYCEFLGTESHFADLALILFDQALLAEGGMPDDPAAYVRRVNALIASA